MVKDISFPHFVSNQLLLADNLNQILWELDKQDRLSRVYLHGIGIFCGFGVSHKVNNGEVAIKIEEGIGLSSDGYLFKSKDCEVHYISNQATSLSSNLFSCKDTFEERFEVSQTNITAFEVSVDPLPLDDNNQPTGRKITENDLKGKLLVLLWGRLEDTPDGSDSMECFSICNETGENYKLGIRKFLISEKDYPKPEVEEEETPDDPVIEEWPSPYIRRFGFDPDIARPYCIDLSRIKQVPEAQNEITLHGEYLQKAEDSLALIQKAYSTAWRNFRIIAVNSYGTDPFAGLETRLSTMIKNFPVPATPDDPHWHFAAQYIYAYCKDLIAAYQEFVEVACELTSDGVICPDMKQFPGHLVLAGWDANCNYDLSHRSNCRQSCFQGMDKDKLEEARCLFERMIKLAKGFFLEYQNNQVVMLPPAALDMKRMIRITASEGRHLPLSRRAIPYYYPPVKNGEPTRVREYWSPARKRKKQTDRIPSYHRPGANLPPYDEHLMYDLDAWGFFRIEGHVGKPIARAYAEIKKLRAKTNLPFDIQCIKLADDTKGGVLTHGEVDCADLVIIYDKILEDLKCKVREIVFAEEYIKEHGAYVTEADVQQAFSNLFKLLMDRFKELDHTNFDLAFKTFELYTIPADGSNPAQIVTFYSTFQEPDIDCCLESLRLVLQEYSERKGAFEAGHLFCNYAAQHPGLEHHGGVSKGGTFVLVYCDLAEAGSRAKVEALGALLKAGPISAQLRAASIGELEEVIVNARQVVIADFCLPYYCCGAGSTAPRPQRYEPAPFLYLYPKLFCWDPEVGDDDSGCPIGVYPVADELSVTLNGQPYSSGTLVRYDAGVKKWSFHPQALSLSDFDDGSTAGAYVKFVSLSISYELNGQTASAEAVVWRKPDATFNNPGPLIFPGKDPDGSIKLFDRYILSSREEQTANDEINYRWEVFRVKETNVSQPGMRLELLCEKEGPESTSMIYDFDRNLPGSYQIRLTVSNPACSATNFETIQVDPLPEDPRPQPEPSPGGRPDPDPDVIDVATEKTASSSNEQAADAPAESTEETTASGTSTENTTDTPTRAKAAQKKKAVKKDRKTSKAKELTDKERAALQNDRIAGYRKKLEDLKADEQLAKTVSFREGEMLLLFLKEDLEELTQRYRKNSANLLSQLKRQRDEPDQRLVTMLQAVTAFYLDRLLEISPDELPDEASETLDRVIEKMEAVRQDRKQLKQAWKIPEVRKIHPDSKALKELEKKW